MECYLCGKDIGEELGACEECRKKADTSRAAEYEALTEEPDRDAWDGEISLADATEFISKHKRTALLALPVLLVIILGGFYLSITVDSPIGGVRSDIKAVVTDVPDYTDYQSYYDELFYNAYSKAKSDGLIVGSKDSAQLGKSSRVVLDLMIAQAADDERDGIASQLRIVELPS